MAESNLVDGYLTHVAPSAIVTEGLIPVPLYSVSAMTLSETYHLPPIGSSGTRALVATHDDTIILSGVLVGKERYDWKFALETFAESGMRGGGGLVAGLSLLGMNIPASSEVHGVVDEKGPHQEREEAHGGLVIARGHRLAAIARR